MPKRVLKVLFFSVLLSSCGGNNPLDVDVSSINVPAVHIKRFDLDLFNVVKGDLNTNTALMLQQYGDFYEGFLTNIVCQQGTKDTAYPREIKRFTSDPDLVAVHNDCERTFKDVSDLEEGLRDIFRHYAFYFSAKKLPVPVAAFTGFNYNIARSDSITSFSLEMYLGEQSKFYDMAQFPMYKRQNMNRENILPDFIKGWMMDEFPDKGIKQDLLNEMIYQGKMCYLTDAFMPDADDTIKIGFSKKQLDWCSRNEANIWGYLLKNQLLYSTSAMDIAQYTHEGPFTTGFVKDSPARTGVWLGWQIVRSYMKKNKNITIPQLMQMNNAQAILDASKYKP